MFEGIKVDDKIRLSVNGVEDDYWVMTLTPSGFSCWHYIEFGGIYTRDYQSVNEIDITRGTIKIL